MADSIDQLEASHATRTEQQTSIGAIDIQTCFIIQREARRTSIADIILYAIIGAIVSEAKLAIDKLESGLASKASPCLIVECYAIFRVASEVLLEEVAGLADGAFVGG